VAPAAAAGSAVSIDPSMTIETPLAKPLIGRTAIPPSPLGGHHHPVIP
jgi:hypothetical protein